jgi:NitT/TauT family transport system substrate-binding protein
MPVCRVWALPIGLLVVLGLGTACASGAPAPRGGAVAGPTALTRPADGPTPAPGPAGAYQPTPLRPPVTVRVGTVNSTSDAGLFIAIEKGYFRDEGIEVETTNFQTAAQMIAPLGTGQLAVATGAIAAGVFNAAARDVPLRIVADKGSTPSPEWDFSALMVRKDLIDSGRVRDYADLKGLTISTTARGNSTEVEVVWALAKGGLTFEDIHYTSLSFTDMISAFANGAIDAAIVIEPYISRIEALGTAVRWRGVSEFYGNHQVAAILYGPGFVREQQEVARRWMIAYIRGLRDYNDAFGPKRQGRDEVLQILAKHTPIKDPRDYEAMRPAGLDPDGKLNLESIARDLEYYQRAGHVTQPIDLAQVIDTSFQEYAVSRLGPYQR